MIRAGFVIENPLTQSRTTILEGDATHWLIELHCVPNAKPDIAEHLHLGWTETFEIVEGAARYKVAGEEKIAQAGERFVVMPGQTHVHPWPAGDNSLVYRQRSDFGREAPDAVQDVLGVFAMVADLARQGKVDAKGLPKHPLQLAATMRTLGKHGGYDASLPVSAQNFLSATLGRLAEALGYQGVDPRYTR